MNLSFLSKSRGTGNLRARIGSILSRFGLTRKKFAALLFEYDAVTKELHCVPTFPITAVILKRHPKLIRKLNRNGVEFAIHGYIHCDYREVSEPEQVVHFKKAIEVFNKCGVPYSGFRAPFLRTNDETFKALRRHNFAYDSSLSLAWDVIDREKYTGQGKNEYDRLVDFYRSQNAAGALALPRFNDGLLEIPVSVPDDEMMVERLGVKDAAEITGIWEAVLNQIYARGELFTLQLHPERILECKKALASVVGKAQQLDPPVWTATLGQIAAWWRERAEYRFTVSSPKPNEYRVSAACSDRAVILCKNCKLNVPVQNWADGYQVVKSREFIVDSAAPPVIGVAPDASPGALAFLQNEGYIVEMSPEPGHYAIYLDDLARFTPAEEKPLLEKIEKSAAPLVRFSRWPDRAKMALTITGDIDSITLFDFAFRIIENWLQRRRNLES